MITVPYAYHSQAISRWLTLIGVNIPTAAIDLTARSIHSPLIIKEALDNWYLTEKKDYDIFSASYPLNGEIDKEKANMDNMITWCREKKISYTPTIFFNGHELPKEYDLEDIQYFLQE